jgi:hypothetical protein
MPYYIRLNPPWECRVSPVAFFSLCLLLYIAHLLKLNFGNTVPFVFIAPVKNLIFLMPLAYAEAGSVNTNAVCPIKATSNIRSPR